MYSELILRLNKLVQDDFNFVTHHIINYEHTGTM